MKINNTRQTSARRSSTGRISLAVTRHSPRRAAVLAASLVLMAMAVWLSPSSASSAEITVFKSPGCGCCVKWADHLRKAGHKVVERNTGNMSRIKLMAGVPDELQSCHTAIVGSYVIEGHVPVREINRLLKEKPMETGLAVAGMPAGSPGMEGGTPDKYDVVLFSAGGKKQVFASY